MRLKNVKKEYEITVPKQWEKKTLYDTRRLNEGLRFGNLKGLAKQHQLKLHCDGEVLCIKGPKDNLQKFLCYLHFAGVTYDIKKTTE